MKFDDLLQPHLGAGTRRPDSPLGHILPPDPAPPTRPTIPPPTCGTLPPTASPIVDLLGILGRFGR